MPQRIGRCEILSYIIKGEVVRYAIFKENKE